MKSLRLFALGMALVSQLAVADVTGSKDHPLISRYPGSKISFYTQADFDQYTLPTGKTVEGKITRITYAAPKGRSVFEVFQNHVDALKKAGFTEAHKAEGQKELGPKFVAALKSSNKCVMAPPRPKEQPRYALYKLERSAGRAWVSVFTTTTSYSGTCGGDIITQLDVLEEKAMQGNLVSANAQAMAEALDKSGHIAIYGIYFDLDSAKLKPESDPTLIEIGKLMSSRPALKLFIVGHTDMTGAFAHNLELSKARAVSVVDELVKKHGIKADRLQAHGVGPLAPTSTNRNEEGRAKNRRVELIER